jgi:iron complex outermembrane receptor protein
MSRLDSVGQPQRVSPTELSALVRSWISLSIAVAIASLTCGNALAQSAQGASERRQRGDFRDVEELSLDDLLDLTVSIAAGRVQPVEEAPGIVSVITDEDIRRMGAQTLADVLQTVPGFEVWTDNLGRDRIAVRGVVTGASENVLILFNGHRLNDHMNGGATVINVDIPVHNLKQIEVIRGPGSALFGTNAFVGVINLVSYTTKNFNGIEASAGVGSFATRQMSIVTGHASGELGVSSAFQFTDTGGPQLLVPADAQTIVDSLVAPLGLRPASLAPRATSDARRSVDFSANAAYKGLAANVRFKDERSGGFIGRVDIFGARNELNGRQFLFDVGQKIPLSRRASVTTSFSFTQSQLHEDLNPTPPGWARVSPTGLLVFPTGILSNSGATAEALP